jgi:pantoate--beta-alanine ligase
VSRLFELVKPQKAYFGQKDYQQLLIIQKLVQLEKLPVEIISCPIVREEDGLAMSSRNIRLTESQRKIAPQIYTILVKAKQMFENTSSEKVISWVEDQISILPEINLEYFQIVDHLTLEPIQEKQHGKTAIGCIAVYLGQVRLIDNLFFN